MDDKFNRLLVAIVVICILTLFFLAGFSAGSSHVGTVAAVAAVASPQFPSPLDGKDNAPNSWHSAHVVWIGYATWRLDDGTFVKLYFTGGTHPSLPEGASGTIYVSVPSYDHDDADNTYYFQKLVPDKKDSQ